MTTQPARLRRLRYRTNPWLVRLPRFQSLVKIRAVPRDRLALSSREYYLEQLERPHAERGNRSCQVEPPHSREVRAILCLHVLERVFEALQPVLQRSRVVHAQV